MYAARRCQVVCLRLALRGSNIAIRTACVTRLLQIAVAVTVDMTTWRGVCYVCFILRCFCYWPRFFYVMCKGRKMPRARTVCLHIVSVPDWANTAPSLNTSLLSCVIFLVL